MTVELRALINNATYFFFFCFLFHVRASLHKGRTDLVRGLCHLKYKRKHSKSEVAGGAGSVTFVLHGGEDGVWRWFWHVWAIRGCGSLLRVKSNRTGPSYKRSRWILVVVQGAC